MSQITNAFGNMWNTSNCNKTNENCYDKRIKSFSLRSIQRGKDTNDNDSYQLPFEPWNYNHGQNIWDKL